MIYVESRVNLRGPPRKAKYSWVTDSEESTVRERWKEPQSGSEIDYETVSLQYVGDLLKIDCVLVEERAGDLEGEAWLRDSCLEAKAKACLNRALVFPSRPEPKWPIFGQDATQVKLGEGPNRVMLKNHRMSWR